MTETEYKVEIDTETGLPVLPEGFMWRVGEDREYGDPEVMLMEYRETSIRTPKKFLGIFETGDYKYVKGLDWVRESSRGFDGVSYEKDDVPAGATITSIQTSSGDRTLYRWAEPINEETILARAIDIMKLRHACEESEREWERLKSERQAVKDKYYGDYPPKTLK